MQDISFESHSMLFKYLNDTVDGLGIRNGHTFLFMPGSRMIQAESSGDGQAEEVVTIPGFDNTMEPTAGTDGLRINIHEPGTTPNPSLEGFDIPPGVSATIGKIHHSISYQGQPQYLLP